MERRELEGDAVTVRLSKRGTYSMLLQAFHPARPFVTS
jgi:hypothetical protein